MTDSLKTYLQGNFLNEREEVERINKIVEEVWPLFLDFAFFDSPDIKVVQDAGWPYEIKDGETPKPPASDKFSYSTNAMILFLIGVVLDSVTPGSLVPEISISQPESRDKESSQEILRNGLTQIARRSNDRKANGDSVFESGSFGLDDPFTITWLLELLTSDKSLLEGEEKKALHQFKSNLSDAAVDRLRSISKSGTLLKWGDSREGDRLSADHMFPLLRFAQISRILERNGIDQSVKSRLRKFKSKLSRSLLDRFHNRMHYHISQSTISSGGFDAAELAFAVEGILVVKDDPQALEPDVLNRVFEIIKRRQEVSSYWRPLKPFVTTPQGSALLPLSVEIASSLLRICRIVDRGPHTESCFSEQIDLFKRYTSWLHARKVKIALRNQKQLYSGWRSEHVHDQELIHPWETSQVLIFLLHYQAMLQEHISRTSRTAAQLKFEVKNLETKKYEADSIIGHFKRFEPLHEHWPKNDSFKGLSKMPAYANLLYRFVAPQQQDLKSIASKAPMYSALVYGPPGTGKTTLARELANALDWDLLTLTPSNFIAGGESEVESRAKDLFEMLQQQERVVILFDEIDGLILDRDSLMYRQQGDMFQFMTPSMLTKIRNLRECKRSIFLIATNYEERIDPAVKRVGRIDCQLMLPPPDKQQRERILVEAMRKQFKSNQIEQMNEQEWAETMKEKEWEEVLGNTVLATYGELTQLVDRTIEEVIRLEDSEHTPGTIAQTLLKESNEQGEPAIRLTSYERRFFSDEGAATRFTPGQQPRLEFFVLVHLVSEARPLEPEEKELLRKVVETLVGKGPLATGDDEGIDEALEKEIKDPIVRDNVKAATQEAFSNS